MHDIYEKTEIYEPFPNEIEKMVVEEDQKYLFPIGVREFNGEKVLIVIPLVDEEGCITQTAINTLVLSEFNFTYSLDVNSGQWSIDSETSNWSTHKSERGDLYEGAKAEYVAAREFYERNGYLTYPLNSDVNGKSELFEVKETPNANSNWFGLFPESVKTALDDDDNVTIYSYEGNKYHFLGNVTAFVYVDSITAFFYYFYEPNTKNVLVIAEYS